jgi:soluble P-type ATPase
MEQHRHTLAHSGIFDSPYPQLGHKTGHKSAVVTSDTYATAEEELKGIVKPHKLDPGKPHDVEKEKYVKQFDLQSVAAFGNGNNDRGLLKAVKKGKGFAIAVDNGEGCALDALWNAHIFIVGPLNALSLLLIRDRCKATLRF